MKRPGRRILMTVDAVGGVWQYAMRLAGALAASGDTILFAGLGPEPSSLQRLQAEAIGSLVWLDVPPEWLAAREAEVEPLAPALDRLVREHRIDLLHLNSPTQAAGLRTAAPVAVVSHSCVATWFRAVRGEAVPAGWDWQVERGARGFARADLVVAPSASHAAALPVCYGSLPRIEVVHNAAIDAGRGSQLGRCVLAAGRWWDEGKNGAVLDEAARLSGWPIHAAGATTGPGGATIAFRHACSLGAVAEDEMRRLMAQCGLFVSPSIYEPFGLAALEAALAGAPLVLSDIPTYRELWDGAAVFFPAVDARALAQTLDWLASDADERRALGEGARERAQLFTPARQASAMRSLYEQAASILAGVNGPMRFIFYTHSLVSDWNHGNAHFQRGIMRELAARGHHAIALQPDGGWSETNLRADQGDDALRRFHADFPELEAVSYGESFDHEAALAEADAVIVHEWTEPALVARIGRARRSGGRFSLLFHDTHHRAVSDRAAIAAMPIEDYDDVLVFGAALRERYLAIGWGGSVHTWHEAADTSLFRPLPGVTPEHDLVWIGNWGDGERSAELARYLVQPVAALGLDATVHGVRYPDEALRLLADNGIAYRGWLANARVPEVFARHRATVHVPRRPYVESLPGIPTIRVFEALACGIPLISAPWSDAEGLFRPGTDFLFARDGAEMARHLRSVIGDPDLAASLAAHGLETIRARHTCAHRVDELFAILERAAPISKSMEAAQ